MRCCRPSRSSCLALGPRVLRNVGGISSGPWGAFGAHLEDSSFRKAIQQLSPAVDNFSVDFSCRMRSFSLFVKAQAVDSCVFLHKDVGFTFVDGEDLVFV